MSVVTEDRETGEAPSSERTLLGLRGISKHFGPVRALNHVDLDVVEGQITALVGDNGAGKSTLIKIIAGIWSPTGGEITWDGAPVQIRSPKEADHLGIAAVYQDLALCDNLDIVQNMFLGHEVLSRRLLDETRMELTAMQTLAVWATPRAAVGSSSSTTREFHSTAFAMATVWR